MTPVEERIDHAELIEHAEAAFELANLAEPTDIDRLTLCAHVGVLMDDLPLLLTEHSARERDLVEELLWVSGWLRGPGLPEEALDALAHIQRTLEPFALPATESVQPDSELEFQLERAGIYSTAIGLARMYLGDKKPDEAKRVLDEAAAKTHALLRDSLIAAGHPAEKVDSFLGAESAQPEEDSSRTPIEQRPGWRSALKQAQPEEERRD